MVQGIGTNNSFKLLKFSTIQNNSAISQFVRFFKDFSQLCLKTLVYQNMQSYTRLICDIIKMISLDLLKRKYWRILFMFSSQNGAIKDVRQDSKYAFDIDILRLQPFLKKVLKNIEIVFWWILVYYYQTDKQHTDKNQEKNVVPYESLLWRY